MEKKFMEHIDEIFEGLYGSSISKYDENKLYSDIYSYEVEEMAKDFNNYLEYMDKLQLESTIEEIVAFIIYLEYLHIGNEKLTEENLNWNGLYDIISKLIYSLYN